jgi:hypothetical protein
LRLPAKVTVADWLDGSVRILAKTKETALHRDHGPDARSGPEEGWMIQNLAAF